MSTAKPTTTPAPGSHQPRGKRRISAIASAAPSAGEHRPDRRWTWPRRPSHGPSDWVERPTSTARSCAPGAERQAHDHERHATSRAATAAPPRTGRAPAPLDRAARTRRGPQRDQGERGAAQRQSPEAEQALQAAEVVRPLQLRRAEVGFRRSTAAGSIRPPLGRRMSVAARGGDDRHDRHRQSLRR